MVDKISDIESQYIGKYVNHSNIPQLNKERKDDVGQPVRAVLKGYPIELYGPNENDTVFIEDSDIDDIFIPAYGRASITAAFNIAIPEDHVGLLWSRSGMSKKHGIECGAGCLDPSYRGLVGVILYNHSHIPYNIKHGDNICQLLTIPIYALPYVQVESLEETDRGDAGFGSSGR